MDISFVISTYNYAAYLEKCINSCIDLISSFKRLNCEILVVDDGSTDNTKNILEKFSSSQIKKFCIENSGVELACNFAFKRANGTYVVRVDADDILLPSYLEGVFPHLAKKHHFIYPDYQVVDSEGFIVERVNLPLFDPAEIRARGDFLATGTLYRRDTLVAIGGYDSRIKNSGLENYELILKLLNRGYLGFHIDQSLFSYRRHGANLSKLKRDQIISNGQALFDRLSLGPYRTNNFHPYSLKLP